MVIFNSYVKLPEGTISRYLKKIFFQACTILHDQIDMTSVVVALIDGANIGMVQLLHDANFLLEVLSHLTCDFARKLAHGLAKPGVTKTLGFV